MNRSRLFLASTLALATMGACKSEPHAETPARSASTTNASTPPAHAGTTAQAIADTLSPPQPGAIPAPADVAAPPADAVRTPSGLASKVLSPGTGTEHPAATSLVSVHYTGWTTNGQMFDSSVARGEPADFPLNRVIPGWTEGVQLMVVGEKRRFWIPQDLAYRGQPGPPAGMLVFDVELLSITAPPVAPAAPSDVAAAPRNAPCTPTGLCTRRLSAGTGTEHPSATAVVTVHYTGWTTDGEMFDSSVVRGSPAQFPLARVVPGFSQGIALMTVGEKRRLWIPQDLAYGGRPGAPAGMLVFDVELVSIDQP
jgi:peptidylprolyl isomerase